MISINKNNLTNNKNQTINEAVTPITTYSYSNRYRKVQDARMRASKNIRYLEECLEKGLIPPSHLIKVDGKNEKYIKNAQRKKVKRTINDVRRRLDALNKEAYELHLYLAKNFPPVQFDNFLGKLYTDIEAKKTKKITTQNRKMNQLQGSQPKKPTTKPTVQYIEGYVVNKSKEEFTREQLELLNKGHKFATEGRPNIEQIIIDIESGINQYSSELPLTQADKTEIREMTSKLIEANNNIRNNKNHRDERILKELREKPVYYVKADKGNTLVILDKQEYDEKMQEKIDNGPYICFRNDPLPNLIKKVDTCLNKCKLVVGENKRNLKEPNPTLPRIKGLPKIHKQNMEYREIVAAERAPTQRTARFLVAEFTKIINKQQNNSSIKNTKQFTERLQEHGSIKEDEIMVSFDVKSLFPSVPVKEAIKVLEEELTNNNIDKAVVKQLIELTRLCMEEAYFTFRGKFYKQTNGLPMGNPLSPFLSDLFMSKIETSLKQQEVLPNLWVRYVDDVFTIIKKDKLQNTLEKINKAHQKIQFTYEEEKDGQLPFLDVLVTREVNSFNFNIYRKPTDTKRVIPSTSNHSFQQKMASFHHMIHRMLTLPLSQEAIKKETEYIKSVAELNGYHTNSIIRIINKKKKQLNIKTTSTLVPDKQKKRRIAVTYDRNITHKLHPKLKKFNIDLVFTSRSQQLTTKFSSTKDPVNEKEKCGIYKIDCSNCGKAYIGQTKRSLDIRTKEHFKEADKIKRSNRIPAHIQSSVARHIIEENHTMNSAKIIKHITNPMKLDAAESLEIHKTSSELLNSDNGNCNTSLFKHIKKRTKRTN